MTDSVPQARCAGLVRARPDGCGPRDRRSPRAASVWPPGVIGGHHGRVPGIYDEPEFYEAACAYRDVPGDVDALLRWFGQHRRTGSARPGTVLELAAGPAEHARNLAGRGLEVTA